MLLEFNPFAFINSNKIAAFASAFFAFVNAEIFDDSSLPAVPEFAFSYFHISENFFIASGASYCNHELIYTLNFKALLSLSQLLSLLCILQE